MKTLKELQESIFIDYASSICEYSDRKAENPKTKQYYFILYLRAIAQNGFDYIYDNSNYKGFVDALIFGDIEHLEQMLKNTGNKISRHFFFKLSGITLPNNQRIQKELSEFKGLDFINKTRLTDEYFIKKTNIRHAQEESERLKREEQERKEREEKEADYKLNKNFYDYLSTLRPLEAGRAKKGLRETGKKGIKTNCSAKEIEQLALKHIARAINHKSNKYLLPISINEKGSTRGLVVKSKYQMLFYNYVYDLQEIKTTDKDLLCAQA